VQAQPHSDFSKFKNTSAYAYNQFDEKAIQIITDSLISSPNPNNLVQLDAYGGVVAKIPADATAFYHRTPLFNLQYQAYWTDDSEQQTNIDWVEKFRVGLLPYTTGAYVNYCDEQIENYMESYYGGNAQKLRTVKTQYDPQNLFKLPQGILPQ